MCLKSGLLCWSRPRLRSRLSSSSWPHLRTIVIREYRRVGEKVLNYDAEVLIYGAKVLIYGAKVPIYSA